MRTSLQKSFKGYWTYMPALGIVFDRTPAIHGLNVILYSLYCALTEFSILNKQVFLYKCHNKTLTHRFYSLHQQQKEKKNKIENLPENLYAQYNAKLIQIKSKQTFV